MNSTTTHIQSTQHDAAVETLRVRVYGCVQGVGFRYATMQQAQQLAVRGWVRNRSDGSVEATIQGSAQQLELMHAWLKQGPRHARVDRIEARTVEDAPAYPDFTQYPDA